MTNNKKLEITPGDIFPQALVIGGGKYGKHLGKTLENRSCQVKFVEDVSAIQGLNYDQFDYILQFRDAADNADDLARKFLIRDGKFILITTANSKESYSDNKLQFKIFLAGNLSSWKEDELTEEVLQALFSRNASGIWDKKKAGKEPPHKDNTTFAPTNNAGGASGRDPDSAEPPIGGEHWREGKLAGQPARLWRGPAFNKDYAKIVEEVKVETKLISKKWLAGMIILLLILFSFSFSIYWYIFSTQNVFRDFRLHLATSNIEALDTDLVKAKEKIALARKTYDFFYNVFFPLRRLESFQNIGEIVTVGEDILNSLEDSISFIKKFELLPSNSFFAKKEVTKKDLEESQLKIESLLNALVLAREKMQKISLGFFPKDNFLGYLDSSIEKLSSLHELLPIFEKIFIPEQTKIYLVLFQNNMELRPTGGFIGSYGILSVAKGKVLDFSIFDVYTADGQLKGHVEPPLPIRKYLEQPNWFLRDSNFDPDFSYSAIQSAWFLQKEMGTNVDGVIGLNLYFAENLMKVLGSIRLTDFNNEEITSDNFFFKTHFYTQKNFFPGSSYKKDFLTSVSRELQSKLLSGKNVPWFEVLSAVKSALDEKNILLYSNAEDSQQEIERAGWGGRLVDVKCTLSRKTNNSEAVKLLKTCFPDYLAINEANLSVNKVNYFIDKSVLLEKRFTGDGLLSSTVTINYENKSIPEVYTGGYYKNYLRIIVPAGSKLINITLNNVPIPTGEVTVDKYGFDKTVFGFLLTIAPGNKATVKITYTLPRIYTKDLESYQFFFQKQGGDKTAPLIINIKTPDNLILDPVNFNPTAKKDHDLLYTTDTKVDRIFVFDLKKK